MDYTIPVRLIRLGRRIREHPVVTPGRLKIIRSMTPASWKRVIVIGPRPDETFYLIDGECRYLIAKELGISHLKARLHPYPEREPGLELSNQLCASEAVGYE